MLNPTLDDDPGAMAGLDRMFHGSTVLLDACSAMHVKPLAGQWCFSNQEDYSLLSDILL